MSVNEFSAVIKNEVFTTWLNALDSNLVTTNVSDVRKAEQAAEKTDFYLSGTQLRKLYKEVTNLEMTAKKAKALLSKMSKKVRSPTKVRRGTAGGSSAIFFESIGFGSITDRVASVFDELEGVQEAYAPIRAKYLEKEELRIRSSIYGGTEDEAADRASVQKYASYMGFGELIHRGHVISIATNKAKHLKDALLEAEQFSETQKTLLSEVLDSYITKLQKDDLASSNFANSPISQKVYTNYTKSSDKYLVELQLKTTNIASGSASAPIIDELRRLFKATDEAAVRSISKSSVLGNKLLRTKGSPSYLELLVASIISTLTTGKPSTKLYTTPDTLVAENKVKVNLSKNTEAIKDLKAQKARIQKKQPKTRLPALRDLSTGRFTSLASLQVLLDRHLQDVVSANMGDEGYPGGQRRILNYRTGRFAASAKVERLAQSKAGMITAFYTYMKNPYATFSTGGAQQYPKTRDPKLLISKSIHEIAATLVGNRLRAVVI